MSQEDESGVQENANEAQKSPNFGELDAKLAEITQTIQAQNAQHQADMNTLVNTITSAVKDDVPPADQNSPEDFYDLKPAEFENRIIDKVSQVIAQRDNQKAQVQNELNTTYRKLVSDYPELNQQGSEMAKKAVEFQSQLPKEMQETAYGYELAVSKAASFLGLKPSNLRTDSDSSFSLGRGSSQPATGERSSKKSKMDPITLEFAQAMGLDINDKKVVERLQQRAERKYNKWG